MFYEKSIDLVMENIYNLKRHLRSIEINIEKLQEEKNNEKKSSNYKCNQCIQKENERLMIEIRESLQLNSSLLHCINEYDSHEYICERCNHWKPKKYK